MDKGIIKSAFFGYSKTSVCEYIAAINQEFSHQLLETENEHKKERDELKDKLAAAEKELEEYKRNYDSIVNALLEAQQYAASLKQKAEEENQRLMAENQRRYQEQAERIARYAASVDRLRSELSDFASETERQLDDYYHQTEEIEKEFEGIFDEKNNSIPNNLPDSNKLCAQRIR